MNSYLLFHAHSFYSIRDSILRIDEYVKKCKELNIIPGLSEHGGLWSSFKFYKECKKQGLKYFTIAQEFYYSDGTEENGKTNYHLIVIAKNNQGWKNLCKLSSAAYINEFYKKPRITRDMLFENSEGLIVSTSCMQGYPQQMLIQGDIEACNKEIDLFYDHFKDDFYLEIHNHGIPEEEIVRDHFRTYGLEKGIKVIAGTDAHFLRKEDKPLHNIFKQLAYGTVGKSDDDGFNGDGYHVMSYEEMLERFNKEEVDNTIEIAYKCNVTFEHSEYHLPKFPLPDEKLDTYEYLRKICFDGLKAKGLDKNQEYIDRLEYELNMLHLANMEDYILIVSDYCNFCKDENILVCPGRGSFAGSLVSYTSGITKVDPIEYKLQFSRAINVGRCLTYKFFGDSQ